MAKNKTDIAGLIVDLAPVFLNIADWAIAFFQRTGKNPTQDEILAAITSNDASRARRDAADAALDGPK